MSRHWFHFEGPDDDDDALPDELAQHEAAALTAIKAIADYGDAHEERRLAVTGTLRKLSTVAGSRAQSLGLRGMKVKAR